MADPSQVYKKFLCQKIALDILRVYMDMNETFLNLLHSESILTDDESLIIEKLRWPSNRNELLQVLIRKAWHKSQFNALLNILKDTQSEQLFDAFSKRAETFIEDEQMKNGEVAGTAGLKRKKILDKEERQQILASQSKLDQFLKRNMTIQDHNAIRAILREKDEDIHQLKIENTELRAQLKVTTEENTLLHNKLHFLDRAVTDLLAAVHFDSDTGSVEDAILNIKTRLEEQNNKIKSLHTELDEQFKIDQDLSERLVGVTDQNNSLKTLYNEKDNECIRQREKYESEIAKLKGRLEKETSALFSWRKRHLTAEAYNHNASVNMQAEIRSLKEELAELQAKYTTVDKEYGKSKQELTQVNDKTRKLLASLDLDNQCDDTRVALDFARNVSYTRRRGSVNTIPAQRQRSARPLESPLSLAGSVPSNGTSTSPENDPNSIFRFSIKGSEQKENNGPLAYSSKEQFSTLQQGMSPRNRRNSLPLSPRKSRANGPSPTRKRGSLFNDNGGGVPIGGLPPIDGRDSPDVASLPVR